MSPGPGGRYVLLDRDGTLTVERRGTYVLDPEEISLLPGVVDGLLLLQRMGLRLLVITNQAPVGRGWIDMARLGEINGRMLDLLRSGGVQIDAVFVCPHRPEDGCECRKPKAGLAERAASELGFVASESFVIGDKASDIEMGIAIGATTILVRTGQGAGVEGDGGAAHVAADLPEAARIIGGLVDGGSG